MSHASKQRTVNNTEIESFSLLVTLVFNNDNQFDYFLKRGSYTCWGHSRHLEEEMDVEPAMGEELEAEDSLRRSLVR